MSLVNEFNSVRGDVDHMLKVTCALEAYGELLDGKEFTVDSFIGQAISLGLESIDPSLDIKEGSYITLRALREGVVKVAKATREAIKVLLELLNSLYVKFTGSLGRVRGHQKNVSKRLGRLGSRVSYKEMEISGINRLSVNGAFVGDKPEYLTAIKQVANYLLVEHPKAVSRVSRVISRRFIDLVEANAEADKIAVAKEGMRLFVETLQGTMRPVPGETPLKTGELPATARPGVYVRSQAMPGNNALVYTDLAKTLQRPMEASNYSQVIRNAFYIDFVELTLNTADKTARTMPVPRIDTLKQLIDGISGVLDIAEKAEMGRRDFQTVKTVVDDTIRQVMDVQDGNGNANTTVVQMLGAISETLAAPMGNFTHWVAVTMNVYLNFIDHCIKHYEAEGV